ncbi:MAG TPA: recombinase RecT, partial [Phycisphaerae bacterium]|nr:recombinase RecT [Phycisphaerae bacterium]
MAEHAMVKYERPMTVPVQSERNLRVLLASRVQQLEGVLAPIPGLNLNALMSYAVDAVLASGDVMGQCDADSVFASIKTACALGLSLSRAMPEAHLVPFKEKGSAKRRCQLFIDYRGYISLVHRATGGQMAAQVVYEGEKFRVVMGTRPRIIHMPNIRGDRSDDKIVAAYSVFYPPL